MEPAEDGAAAPSRRYRLICEGRQGADGVWYPAYAVAVRTPGGPWTVAAHDVALSREAAQRLAARLERCQPSSLHVPDILLDTLE